MVLPTPLERAPDSLSRGHAVYLKREDVHELGAFKWRGALPTLEQYVAAGASVVVTASTGNHGAATAWAARQLDLRAVVYAPEGTSRTKLALMDELGAEIRLHGVDVDEAKDEARAWAGGQAVPFFEDGAEPAQLDGYAAIARELLEQLPEPPAAVIVPVGNGALLAGVGRTLREQAPATLRVGVAASEAPVMVESWRAARPVESYRSGTFADGLAVRVAIPLRWPSSRRPPSGCCSSPNAISLERLQLLAGLGIRVEGAAAAGLAALEQLDDVDGAIVLVDHGPEHRRRPRRAGARRTRRIPGVSLRGDRPDTLLGA